MRALLCGVAVLPLVRSMPFVLKGAGAAQAVQARNVADGIVATVAIMVPS